jgi:hypothetical protein
LALVLVGGYLGFVPIVSNVLAKQRDLGVEIDHNYYSAVSEQLGIEMNLSDPDGVPSYEGTVPLEESFSSEQASSILAGWETLYDYIKYVPFEDVQIKIHEDGTAEMSAILNVAKGIEIAREMGYTGEEIDEGLKYVKFVNNRMPFYAKGRAGIQNGQVFLEGDVLEIGRVKVPENILKTVETGASSITEQRISQIPGLNVDSIELKNSKAHVSAEIPQKVSLGE